MEKEQKENIQNENLDKQENNQSDKHEDQTNDHNKKEEENKKELTAEEKILELEDKLARAFAEMENQRRRFEKEKEDAFEYGGFSFAKEALSLIDNFEKTLEHFDIIHKDLISIFNKNDIKQIDSLNKKLDPNFHQAMMEIEDDTKEPGTIIQEIQKGFTIKDRLLRPSLVGVAKKTQEKEAKTEETKENSETK